MRDETPSSLETLNPSKGLSRFPSLRTGPGSKTQMQLFAGSNASAVGDRTLGTLRAWHGTHFPDSLQKPLPEHADLHAETQQIHLDQRHQEIWPES